MPRSPRLIIQSHDPLRKRQRVLLFALAWLLSLLAAAGLTLVLRATIHPAHDTLRQASIQAERDTLKRRIATLERSEQIARTALAEVQQTLRERDEELEGLRADLAFYSRLVGGSKREGLALHAFALSPVANSHAWNFSVMLSQNFRRGQEIRGRLTLSVEGIRNGALTTLDWPQLGANQDRSGIDYSFKYFQQVGGTIMLPGDFAPNRVIVRADGEGGQAEQEFSWREAAKLEEAADVSK